MRAVMSSKNSTSLKSPLSIHPDNVEGDLKSLKKQVANLHKMLELFGIEEEYKHLKYLPPAED